MAVSPLSGFSLAPTEEDNGLVIGYGNTAPELYGSLLGRLAMLARQAKPS
jgi:GntR family transcriptional regulator/MocR family aminotransferase